METWRDQNKEHLRLISRFNEIGNGKMLSVDKSRNDFDWTFSTLQQKEPGSLNYTLRKDFIEQTDKKNIQLLERLANPKISDYVKFDTHSKFWN